MQVNANRREDTSQFRGQVLVMRVTGEAPRLTASQVSQATATDWPSALPEYEVLLRVKIRPPQKRLNCSLWFGAPCSLHSSLIDFYFLVGTHFFSHERPK